MSLPPITFVQFAWLCTVIYNTGMSRAGTFTRHSPMDRRLSGFQGAVFRRATGTGLDWVVTVAGTQPTEDMGVDIVADAGFGGSRGSLAAGILFGAAGHLLGAAGGALLAHQCGCAEALVQQARGVMGRNDRIVITGHSLGGGIAQIVSARTGVPAVAISAPAVTGVDGVEASWTRSRSRIVCLRIKNDPINHTGAVGRWLGRVVPLNSPRSGGDAHSIDQTWAELMPSGAFSALGGRDPFTV